MSSKKTTLTVGVSGMTCGSCVNTVTNALKAIGSDVEVNVSLASGTVHVTGSTLTFDSVKDAIESCGFMAGPCGSIGNANANGGRCSAGSKCTCGDNCQCGTNCRCVGCSGTCGVSVSNDPCPAKAAGTCTCGEVCTCGPNCACVGCPGNANASCGASTGACPAKAAGTCTCGPSCACGSNCKCAGCPGSSSGKLLTNANIIALAVVGAAVVVAITLTRRK